MTRPLASTRLRIAGKRFLKVVVWSDEKETTSAWRRTDGEALSGKLSAGEYVDGFCVFDRKPGTGEIHLSLRHMKIELWAHELQHLIIYEIKRRLEKRQLHDLDERMATMSARLTRDFCKWFNRAFVLDA